MDAGKRKQSVLSSLSTVREVTRSRRWTAIRLPVTRKSQCGCDRVAQRPLECSYVQLMGANSSTAVNYDGRGAEFVSDNGVDALLRDVVLGGGWSFRFRKVASFADGR